jgi:hypothetical protein
MTRTIVTIAALLIGSYASVAFGTEPDDRPPVARSATATLRQLVGEETWTRPGLDGPAREGPLPCDGTPVGPPPNPGVGDSWDWYIWRLNGFPEADLLSCTVRGMGPNCYVVVEDSQWNVNIDQAQVDAIVAAFEEESIGIHPDQGIWDINTTYFGDPPDPLDADPRVYILYYDFDVAADGFFWAFDQQCDDVAAFNSNECDVVYMNCSDYDPAGPYLLAVLAHEFEHLIHYNYDPNEAAWLDEGLAELAMWLYGNPDVVSSFPAAPDRDLTTFDGAWADYIKSYLWSLYVYERYGGQPTIRALVAEPSNSIQAHDAVLADLGYAERFVDVFGDWVVANYVDDTTIGDGRFGYLGETLPPFAPFGTFSTYPVGPQAASVQHWAADYARYLEATDLLATFDGSDTNGFRVRAILLDDVSPTEIVDMSLDAAQSGSLSLPQIGSTHDEAVLVYAGAQSTGTTSYMYGAQADVVGTPGSPVPPSAFLSARPRDGAIELSFALPGVAVGERIELAVFDAAGRRVRAWSLLASGSPGERSVSWDVRTLAGHAVASGTYFVRLSAADARLVARATVVR